MVPERIGRSRCLVASAMMVVIMSAGPSFAVPDSKPAPGPKPASVPPPSVSSPWQTWRFSAPPERVKAELLALFKEDGLPLESEDAAAGSLHTGRAEFDKDKFGQQDVSIPPPRASEKYPYYQLIAMTSGRLGFECKLSPLPESQTRIDLRARLEIRAYDRNRREWVWVPRYSNGLVERTYFNRLTLRLVPPPQTTGLSR